MTKVVFVSIPPTIKPGKASAPFKVPKEAVRKEVTLADIYESLECLHCKVDRLTAMQQEVPYRGVITSPEDQVMRMVRFITKGR